MNKSTARQLDRDELDHENLEKLSFKLASSTNDKNLVFLQRYQVLVETDHYLPENTSKMIFDYYDELAETSIIAAYVDEEIIGSVRVVFPNGFGIPSDDYLDFSKLKIVENLQIADLSRVSVKKEYRRLGLAAELMKVGHFLAKKRGMQAVCGVSNPKVLSLFKQLGWQAVGPESFCEKYQLPFIPIIGLSGALLLRDGFKEKS